MKAKNRMLAEGPLEAFLYLYKMRLFASAVSSRLMRMRFTLAVISINFVVFILAFCISGSLNGPTWNATLLRLGAQFAPLTLDKEAYRIISHLFLHASVIHLLLNQYILAYLGYHLEARIGSKKFLLLFFVSGVSAALGSMYLNVFTLGLGTSGAISGIFGFYLVNIISFNQKTATPALVLLFHFAAFAVGNLFLPELLSADYAGLFGGVGAGILIGFLSFPSREKQRGKLQLEYVMVPVLVSLFLMMPGYQVRYFKFFKQVVAAEDTTRHLMKEKLTDDDMRSFIRNYHHWEEIRLRLSQQSGLPADLSADTFRLARYIDLRKQENMLKKMIVQREAYAYLDSIERLQEVMRRYMDLDYGLWSRIRDSPASALDEARMTTVYYDSSGAERHDPPGLYHRIGVRDSVGRWDGPFREFDREGRLRVKGSYKLNKKDGVFLYYADNGVCTEAGRYLDDKKFGKWQTFYRNGRLASEIFYTGGSFVKNVWDSLGTQLVVDGNGKQISLYSDDVVKEVGEYRHGVKDGTWYGRYPNGDMYYEEVYSQGRLLSGKSRAPGGETFVYDETSLFPFPEGGFVSFQEYLRTETRRFASDELGHVKLSFRVGPNGGITNLAVIQSASASLDAKAKEILQQGPRWFPARKHGHEPVYSDAVVQIDFY